MYKFELNEREIATYKAWKATLKEKHRRIPVVFIFTTSGIGTSITAMHGKKSKDITDYSSF
jgi:hypothetical protein